MLAPATWDSGLPIRLYGTIHKKIYKRQFFALAFGKIHIKSCKNILSNCPIHLSQEMCLRNIWMVPNAGIGVQCTVV